MRNILTDTILHWTTTVLINCTVTDGKDDNIEIRATESPQLIRRARKSRNELDQCTSFWPEQQVEAPNLVHGAGPR